MPAIRQANIRKDFLFVELGYGRVVFKSKRLQNHVRKQSLNCGVRVRFVCDERSSVVGIQGSIRVPSVPIRGCNVHRDNWGQFAAPSRTVAQRIQSIPGGRRASRTDLIIRKQSSERRRKNPD